MGITIVALLMIVFGVAELVTGFQHNFIGLLVTRTSDLATFGGTAIGTIYAIGGLLLLTRKKWAASVAMICIVIVVLGRISLVLAGLYPTDSPLQTVSIIIGTSIAIGFGIYIVIKRNSFN
jgi:hypothetical protein